ncbi:MAG: carboxymuconolactone decarboxylase family protein [Betaproteobacteria bacterium]|nr:carboxymuconolactone decarboxylase family protein [Betaproteobacteria bacterium]
MSKRRFAVLDESAMTEAQRKARSAIVSGPRGDVRGPFNALLRSPELADRVQKVGEYIRFGSSLPAKLNELAILVTARYWSAQYEWYAHHQFALKAGLDSRLAADIAEGRRPLVMSKEEAAVHDFCRELHQSKQVGDETYAAALACFGEQGVIDLIGACGYYTLVSMVLNVDRYPMPEGLTNPLK